MAKKFTLKHPVTVGELTLTELTLARPTIRDFVAVGEHLYGTAGADAALLSSLSGQPENVIGKLDIEDGALLRTYVGRIWVSWFTGTPFEENPTPPPETGAKKETVTAETVST